MRAFVITTFALAVALVPAAALAQATTSTPPAQEAAPAPKVPFTTPAGILLVSIKPDKTAVFEEIAGKLKAGAAKTADETLKKQLSGLKIYKVTEPAPGPAVLYVILVEPSVPASEYELFSMLQKTMTPEELRAPEAQAMWTRYADAFLSGMNKLSLTALGG
jgi:hypothetical protein